MKWNTSKREAVTFMGKRLWAADIKYFAGKTTLNSILLILFIVCVQLTDYIEYCEKELFFFFPFTTYTFFTLQKNLTIWQKQLTHFSLNIHCFFFCLFVFEGSLKLTHLKMYE